MNANSGLDRPIDWRDVSEVILPSGHIKEDEED